MRFATPHPAPVKCAVCGTSHWRNPKPAAAALVTRSEGELLLVKRAHAPWRDRWCAPSGFCDADEHPIATAERETLEETGISAVVTGYLGTWMSCYAEDDALAGEGRTEDDITIAVAYYHARPLGEDAFAFDPAEIADVGWFGPAEIPWALAPPSALPAILVAWRAARLAGETDTPLRDRPTSPF